MSIVVENLRSQRLAPDLRDESPDGGGAAATGKAAAEEVDECGGLLFPSQSCSSSSSIGKNSDLESEEEDDRGGEEVQSSYNGSLNSINDLEEALPIRRGISSFYNGKSRSFMSLAEASSAPSIAEIAKPEDAYTRKRKNQLAFRHGWDRTGLICKRPIRPSRSTLALAVEMGSSNSISSNDSSSSSDAPSLSPATAALPPLRQRARLAGEGDLAPWRSFSVADLRQCHGRV